MFENLLNKLSRIASRGGSSTYHGTRRKGWKHTQWFLQLEWENANIRCKQLDNWKNKAQGKTITHTHTAEKCKCEHGYIALNCVNWLVCATAFYICAFCRVELRKMRENRMIWIGHCTGKKRKIPFFRSLSLFQRLFPFFDKYSFWWYLNRTIFILVWIKNIKCVWKSDDEENETIVAQKIQKIWNTESSNNSTEIGQISEPICLLCHAESENSFRTFGNG